MSDWKYQRIIVPVVSVELLRLKAANTTEYYDEAWVAMYNATDGEPKTSNLVGRFPDFNRSLGYRDTCYGKAAKHLNIHQSSLSRFYFTLTDTEFSESLKCV